jgi:hypothetical protein
MSTNRHKPLAKAGIPFPPDSTLQLSDPVTVTPNSEVQRIAKLEHSSKTILDLIKMMVVRCKATPTERAAFAATCTRTILTRSQLDKALLDIDVHTVPTQRQRRTG